jgi:hypothetical protein
MSIAAWSLTKLSTETLALKTSYTKTTGFDGYCHFIYSQYNVYTLSNILAT